MQGIYQIKNRNTNMVYIGSSKDIENRWKQHIRKLNKGDHHSYKLQNAWDIWKKDSFVFEILEYVENEKDLIKKEQEYIDKLKSYEFGYNVSELADNKKRYSRKYNNLEKGNYDNLNFVKVYHDELKLLLPLLNQKEKSLLLSLIPYVSFHDNCLKHDNGKHIKIKTLQKITGLKKSIYPIIKSLIDKHIIYKTENKVYYINPWIVSKGNEINIELLFMFQNYYIQLNKMTWLEFYCQQKGIEYNGNLKITPYNKE